MKRCRGVAYLALMIGVAIVGVGSAMTVTVASFEKRRSAEAELLVIGAEFKQALQSYADSTPPGQVRAPRTLQALLKDPRFPGTRRHLRRIYADPITGKAEWGLILDRNGGILGIHSLSEQKTIKVTGFPSEFARLENSKSYKDWGFTNVSTPE